MCGFCFVESVSLMKTPMGRFFFVEAKSFEFIIEPRGNSFRLRIVEWEGLSLFNLSRER